MGIRVCSIILVLLLLSGCQENVLPKPRAMLKLEFPNGEYSMFEDVCNYKFELNGLANPQSKGNCNLVLDYPMMKGSVYITYKKVDQNLEKLLVDAQKLSYEHVVKADNIIE